MLKFAHRIITFQKHAPRFLLSTDNWQGEDVNKKSQKPGKTMKQEKTSQNSTTEEKSSSESTKKWQQKSKQQSNEKKIEKQQKQEKEKFNRESQYDDDDQPQYEKQNRRTLGWTIYRILFWGSAALLSYNTYLVSIHDKKTPVQNETGAIPGFITAAKAIYQYYDQLSEFFTKPPLDKLMPDIVHPQFQPKTLVLNVRGTLLETEYIFGKGLTVSNRPGLQQFLKKMSQIYEVVIFSDDDSMLLNTLISSLDPRRQFISGYFGNECMVFSRGKYIKDLKYLNRDLKKVIVIDKNKSVVQKHKQNVIVLSEYKGDDKDRELIQLTSLLESLSKPEIADVRKTLQEMGQNPIKWYEQNLKQKQQKIKGTQNSKLFGFFSSKKN